MKARLLMIALSLALPASSIAAPTGQGRMETSPETGAVSYWRFSRCVVKFRPDSVAELLSSWIWGDHELEAATRLAQGSASCLTPNVELRFAGLSFQGFLGAATLEAKYRDQALPDYSAVPYQFTQVELDLEQDGNWKAGVLRLMMAECAFRLRSQQVIDLFATKPMSDEADLIWPELIPVLGECMPLTEGTEAQFDRISLRAYLGEAAYALDKAFEEKSQTSVSAS